MFIILGETNNIRKCCIYSIGVYIETVVNFFNPFLTYILASQIFFVNIEFLNSFQGPCLINIHSKLGSLNWTLSILGIECLIKPHLQKATSLLNTFLWWNFRKSCLEKGFATCNVSVNLYGMFFIWSKETWKVGFHFSWS